MKFSTDMVVELIDHMGNDNSICNAARVSTGNHQAGYDESKGLINYLYREGHTSPFEHVTATFRLEVPIFIARQIMRHRVFSYNEISGRYSELPLVFWLPADYRPLKNEGSGAYPDLTHHEDHDVVQYIVETSLTHICHQSTLQYHHLLEMGVATEVARAVLPLNTYTQFYMTGSLHNFFDFISKRTVDNAQEEVYDVASKMLEYLDTITPLAVQAYDNAR